MSSLRWPPWKPPMSWVTFDSPAAASAAVNRTSYARVSHVEYVSPVNASELRRSDQGPVAKVVLSPLPCSVPPIRVNAKPRSPRDVSWSAYAWLTRLSAPTCGSEETDAPQPPQ